MTNYYDNLVFFIRNTSLTPDAIDNLVFYDYEMILSVLKRKLDDEAANSKQEQGFSSKFNSMANQMKSFMSGRK